MMIRGIMGEVKLAYDLLWFEVKGSCLKKHSTLLLYSLGAVSLTARTH